MTRDATSDHWQVLGLAPGSSAAVIQAARRRLAKRAHPDVGGSAPAMQAINAAAEAALAELARSVDGAAPGHTAPGPRPGGFRTPRRSTTTVGVRVDHPSFVIEALPAEAFEWLLVASAELGDVIDDDPPYRLEVALRGDVRGWCELSLVPDAGASTVSVAVAGEPGYPAPDVELVRDLFITAVNSL